MCQNLISKMKGNLNNENRDGDEECFPTSVEALMQLGQSLSGLLERLGVDAHFVINVINNSSSFDKKMPLGTKECIRGLLEVLILREEWQKRRKEALVKLLEN